MLFIETGSCTPAVNLAYEEYFLKGRDLEEDICLIWRNEPSVIIGKFQNTLEELDLSFTESHQIQVLRRISGGGTVYQDLGNLCFSFIRHGLAPHTIDKPALAKPLIDALMKMGLAVTRTNRNDLTIDGKKFSGNAMALHKDRLLYHGTLLFDTDLEMLTRVLKNSPTVIESKAVKSIRASVTNLKPYLGAAIDILQFKQLLKEYLLEDPSRMYHPSVQDLEAIHSLVESKYQTWEWNFGSNPNSKLTFSAEFIGNMIRVTVELEKGRITHCQIEGIFPNKDLIAQRLVNARYCIPDIQNVLAGLEPGLLPETITIEGLARLLLGYAEVPGKESDYDL